MTVKVNPMPHIKIKDGTSFTPRLKDLEKELEKMKEEIAEMILLESQPEAVSTYGMSYEEQAELPYRARL